MAIEVIVRAPKRTGAYTFARWFVTIGFLFLFAWFVTMLTPIALGIHVGYWQAVSLLVLVRLILPARFAIPFLLPSEEAKKENK